MLLPKHFHPVHSIILILDALEHIRKAGILNVAASSIVFANDKKKNATLLATQQLLAHSYTSQMQLTLLFGLVSFLFSGYCKTFAKKCMIFSNILLLLPSCASGNYNDLTYTLNVGLMAVNFFGMIVDTDCRDKKSD